VLAVAYAFGVQVQGLRKLYAGGRGVEDVSLSAPRGAITGFIGANGAGKSTTLRCILGILAPDGGRIALFGEEASAAARRRIGFIPEERGLNPADRARDAVAFHARMRDVPRREAYRRADELLERVGLGEVGRSRVGRLSKGNAQRVQLLCAFAHDPELLILDEPFSGLDPMAQEEVRDLLTGFRDRGGSVLLSTHALLAAERMCDRVTVLSAGRTLFDGPTARALGREPDLPSAYRRMLERAA